MKISIITVCFNSKDSIIRCIESVISQDFEDFEYIIIDGASDDSTVEIIQKYSARIDKIISEPDHGIYDAMNKGLSLAKGDWILFLNSDDMLCECDTLSKAAKYLINKSRNYYGIAKIVHKERVLYSKPFISKPISFENELPIHQSVFISRLYKGKLFDTTYTIVADSIYLYELSKKNQFEFMPIYIVNFSLGGVSSYYTNFSKCKNHLSEHLRFLSIKNVPVARKIYTILAFTSKYILCKFLSKDIYFEVVSHVAQLKAKL